MVASQISIAKNFYVVCYSKRNQKKQFACGDVLQCISYASGKVLPRVAKFYREIFQKCRFSNTSRRLLLKLPRNNQSILIQSQVAERQHISYGFFFKLFMRVITVFSSHFCRDQVKMLFDIRWKGNDKPIGPRKGYFC